MLKKESNSFDMNGISNNAEWASALQAVNQALAEREEELAIRPTREQLHEAQLQTRELLVELDAAKKQIVELNNSFAEREQAISKELAQQKIEIELRPSIQQLHEAQEQAFGLSAELDETREQLADKNRIYEEHQQALKRDIAQLEKALASRPTHEQLTRAQAKAEEIFTELEDTKGNFTEQIRAFNEREQTYKQALSELEKALASRPSNEQLNRAQVQASELFAELSDVKRNLAEQGRVFAEREQELHHALTQMEMELVAAQSSSSKCAEAQELVCRLREELGNVSNQLVFKSGQLRECEAALVAAKNRLDQQNKELERSTKALILQRQLAADLETGLTLKIAKSEHVQQSLRLEINKKNQRVEELLIRLSSLQEQSDNYKRCMINAENQTHRQQLDFEKINNDNQNKIRRYLHLIREMRKTGKRASNIADEQLRQERESRRAQEEIFKSEIYRVSSQMRAFETLYVTGESKFAEYLNRHDRELHIQSHKKIILRRQRDEARLKVDRLQQELELLNKNWLRRACNIIVKYIENRLAGVMSGIANEEKERKCLDADLTGPTKTDGCELKCVNQDNTNLSRRSNDIRNERIEMGMHNYQKSVHQVRSIWDLLELQDEELLESAYKTLLTRAVDPAGRDTYLRQLRAGISRETVVRDIATSLECRIKNIKLAGLSEFLNESKKGFRWHLFHLIKKCLRSGDASGDELIRKMGNEMYRQISNISHQLTNLDVRLNKIESKVEGLSGRNLCDGKAQFSLCDQDIKQTQIQTHENVVMTNKSVSIIVQEDALNRVRNLLALAPDSDSL